MLQALENIKSHAEGILAGIRVNLSATEDDLKALLAKIEYAIERATGMHTANESAKKEPEPAPAELPAGYPPITPS